MTDFFEQIQTKWDVLFPGLVLKHDKNKKGEERLWFEFGKLKSSLIKIQKEEDTYEAIRTLEVLFEHLAKEEGIKSLKKLYKEFVPPKDL